MYTIFAKWKIISIVSQGHSIDLLDMPGPLIQSRSGRFCSHLGGGGGVLGYFFFFKKKKKKN
jgi:hypothetical protein